MQTAVSRLLWREKKKKKENFRRRYWCVGHTVITESSCVRLLLTPQTHASALCYGSIVLGYLFTMISPNFSNKFTSTDVVCVKFFGPYVLFGESSVTSPFSWLFVENGCNNLYCRSVKLYHPCLFKTVTQYELMTPFDHFFLCF